MPYTTNAGSTLSTIVEVQTKQTSDFVATAGSNGLEHLWPIDVSASPAASQLTVTAPTSPTVGDKFSVADHTLSCTLTRIIRVNFNTEPIMGLPAPDYAEINDAGAKLTFIYVDASIGWEIASNVNA